MRAPSRAFAALVGACLLAAVGAENSHPTSAATRAWTMRVGLESDVQLDPSLADIYDPAAYLTCLKLLRYTSTRRLADSRLVPEAAVAMPHLSRDHKTYVFTLRRRLRFSDGSPVTAANYAAAIRRILNPAMRSPGAQGIPDIASVRASRLKLTVTLKRPAGDFLARVGALSFACPIPTDLPVNPAGVDLRMRAGPYFIRAHRANRELVLRRNPYYRGGRRNGPQTIDFRIGASEAQLLAAVERGRLDYAMTGIPDDVAARLARRYGVDERRFYVVPQLQTTFLGMNNARPLLQGNVALRRAINLVLDRRAIVRQIGFTRGWTLTDQLLPPGMRGFRRATLYPLRRPALARARRLAGGHLRGGRAVLYTTPERTALAVVVKSDLARIGLHVDVTTVSRPVYFDAIQSANPPFDLVITGWISDWPDPGDFLDTLGQYLPWTRLADSSALAEADRLVGPARYRRFGRLDVDMMRNQALVAPIVNAADQALVAPRIGCVRFQQETPGQIDVGAACMRKP